MRSSVIRHFPQVRFRDGQKLLWNPVLKKTYADLPEERVRLAYVDYLHLECGHSLNRISFESPASLPGDRSGSRTDLICYDKQFKPHLLVECKAPSVRISEKVLHQIARYNARIEAPYMLVTNGTTDLYIDLQETEPVLLNKPPEPYRPSQNTDRDQNYWCDRGFIGDQADPAIMNWLGSQLPSLYLTDPAPRPYLSLRANSDIDDLSSWYQIIELENDALALSIAASPEGRTLLTVILNQEGKNTSFIRIDLQMAINKEAPNYLGWSDAGIQKGDILHHLNLSANGDILEQIGEIHVLLSALA